LHPRQLRGAGTFGRCRTGVFFRQRLHQYIRAVELFRTADLQHGLGLTRLLELDHGHILKFAFRQGHLQHDGMGAPVVVIDHPDVIHLIIAIEVEVVHLAGFFVQGALERFKVLCALEQLQGPGQVEVITGQARAIHQGPRLGLQVTGTNHR
jgi:hypothetical protein